MTGQLDHPGVPAVYDRGVGPDGTPWYAMRRVQGSTLGDRLALATSLAERLDLLPALVDVAHAVAYAHERGVVHRDLKPANVVVGPHGQAVLLDWGLAKVRGVSVETGEDDDPFSEHTRHGSVLGTPAYMAPEQAQGRPRDVDERTDVFALGALLYHLLAGRPPYARASSADALADAVAGRRLPLESLAPNAPLALRRVAERAMELDPARRHPTAGAFADALQGVLVEAVSSPVAAPTRLLAAAVSGLTALATLVMAVAAATTLPTLREMGPLADLLLLLGLCGLALAVVEWRTRGRLRLRSMVLALGAAAFLQGLGGTTIGLGHVAGHLRSENLAVSPLLIASKGAHEALGSVSLGAVFAGLLVVAWGLLGRVDAVPPPSPSRRA